MIFNIIFFLKSHFHHVQVPVLKCQRHIKTELIATFLVTNSSFIVAQIDGRKNYIRRSCKTSDAAKALEYARAKYDELRIKHASGGALVKLTYASFFERWLKENKVQLTEKRHH